MASKFVLIDVCMPNDHEAVAAITMGRSEVIKMFDRHAQQSSGGRNGEAWRLAKQLFHRHDWEPGNAMQLPGGAGWLFSVHHHVEL